MGTLNTIELSKKTGASQRSILRWLDYGILTSVESRRGYTRVFDDDVVDRVALLAKLSNSIINIRYDLLKEIYDGYKLGEIWIADGVVISWEV